MRNIQAERQRRKENSRCKAPGVEKIKECSRNCQKAKEGWAIVTRGTGTWNEDGKLADGQEPDPTWCLKLGKKCVC